MLAGLRSGALLRISPEDLPLEPGHPRQSCLEFVGQIGDLSLLLPNDMLQMLCLLLPGRFPHGSTSMQRSPVVRLLTKLDLQTTDFDILHEHADMVENSTVCVQLPRMESPRRHEDEHGFTECLHRKHRHSDTIGGGPQSPAPGQAHTRSTAYLLRARLPELCGRERADVDYGRLPGFRSLPGEEQLPDVQNDWFTSKTPPRTNTSPVSPVQSTSTTICPSSQIHSPAPVFS